MSNKYLGHSGGLIGPVEMEKPEFNKLDLKNKLSILRYNDAASKYIEHLASLPRIPCEGWKPEVGAELVEGVDFRRDELITLEGGKEISRRIVAVPLPAAQPSQQEEGSAYLQPAPAAVTDAGDGGFTKEDMYMLAAKVTDDIAANNGNGEWNLKVTPQMIADDFINNGHQFKNEFYKPKLSPTYPAEFVEWAEGSEWCFWQGQGWRKLTAKGIYLSTTELYQEWKRIKEQSK